MDGSRLAGKACSFDLAGNCSTQITLKKKKLSYGEILDWKYEPVTFHLCVKNYTPDFQVLLKDGTSEYHEVKGWMDKRSELNVRLMKKLHPSVVLKVIDKSHGFKT